MNESDQYLIRNLMASSESEQIAEMDQQRNEKLLSAKLALQDNDLNQATSDIEWLSLEKQLREYVPSHSTARTWTPFFIGFICLLLFALSLQPVSSSKIQMDLMVSGLEFRLADSWSPNVYFHPDAAMFSSISEINAGVRTFKTDSESFAEVQAKQMDLEISDLPQDAIVRFFRKGAELQMLFAPGPNPLSAEVHLTEGHFMLSQPNWDTTVADLFPSSFQLYAQAGNTAINWTLQDSQQYLLRDIPTIEPEFHQQIRSGRFESTVLSGTIQLLSSGDSYQLAEGEVVKIRTQEAFSIRKLQILPSGFRITTEVEVSTLDAGPPGFEQSLMPSWLMYFSKDQGFKYIWLALGWLWTFLWSVKRTIF